MDTYGCEKSFVDIKLWSSAYQLGTGSRTGGKKACENLCFYSDCPLVLLLFSLSFSVYPTSLVWHSWSGPFLEPVCLSVSPRCSYPFYFLETRILVFLSLLLPCNEDTNSVRQPCKCDLKNQNFHTEIVVHRIPTRIPRD